MLLDYLKKYFAPDTAPGVVNIVKYENYLTTMIVRRTELLGRYMGAYGTETPGVRMLKHILGLVDIAYLKQLKNDYDRYTFYFKYIGKDLGDIIDANGSVSMRKEMFIHKHLFTAAEFIIPVSSEDHLKALPMMEDWEAWKDVRALRLVDHDSEEYTINTIQSNVRFRAIQPSYAVITIDPIILAFKYFKYRVAHEGDDADLITPQRFIHKHILNTLMMDLQDIWLRDQIINAFYVDKLSDLRTQTPANTTYDNMYGYVGLQYRSAMGDIWRVVQELKSGRIKPNMFFDSVSLSTGSIKSHLITLLEENYIPPLRQFAWETYLRDMKWVELILLVYSANPNDVKGQTLRKAFRIKVNNLHRTQFWNNIHDIVTRTLVKDHITDIKLLLN